MIGIQCRLWHTNDYLSSLYYPLLGLSVVNTVSSTNRCTTFAFLAIFISMQFFVKDKILNYLATASKEEIIIAFQQSFKAMMQVLFMMFLLMIGRQKIRQLSFRKHALIREKNVTQHEALIKVNSDLKKAIEARDTFILSFSHETRNPLNGILGNLQVLLEKELAPEIKTHVNKAFVCGKILANIITTILDSRISRDHLGNLRSNSVCTNMPKYLEEIWILCHEIIKAKKLTPILDISPCFPRFLKIDPERMTQVILNLINNAAKFTEKGLVRLSLQWIDENKDLDERFCTAFDIPFKKGSTNFKQMYSDNWFTLRNLDNSGVLRITIEDTGCGISKESKDLIFQKFAQVNDSMELKRLGLGLGLWITKNIIDLYQGTIELESQERVGSCFVVNIPTVCSSQNFSAFSNASLTEVPKIPKTTRALVVEDIPINQEINVRMLKKYGIDEVFVASNGMECVDVVKKRGPNFFNLITMDLEMPVMDGKEAIIRVRDWEATNGFVPHKIVIISGNATESEMDKCLNKSGRIKANAFLTKPCDFNRLCETLQTISVKSLKIPKKKKILIADDDFFNIDTIVNFAKMMSVEYMTASNGRQAVEAFEKSPSEIGLVLIDYQMPFMNGIEAGNLIKAKAAAFSKNANIPVYLITGDELVQSPNSSLDGMISKPISFESFQRLVLHYLC